MATSLGQTSSERRYLSSAKTLRLRAEQIVSCGQSTLRQMGHDEALPRVHQRRRPHRDCAGHSKIRVRDREERRNDHSIEKTRQIQTNPKRKKIEKNLSLSFKNQFFKPLYNNKKN